MQITFLVILYQGFSWQKELFCPNYWQNARHKSLSSHLTDQCWPRYQQVARFITLFQITTGLKKRALEEGLELKTHETKT